MKVGFIGCVDSSEMALRALLNIDGVEVVAVITRESSLVNSDFRDLSGLCLENGIPFHYEDPNCRSDSISFMEAYCVDVIYCIGWSYLLGQEMLSLPPLGVIGFHPAKLPQNRGRHPIIWALVLGLEETASTFFKMDEGADSGPILSQEVVAISKDDCAGTLYQKILSIAEKQVLEFTALLRDNEVKYIEQDHTHATYWRKRSRVDGVIDFRMQAESIHNLVRALAPPYPCAEIVLGELVLKVTSSSPVIGAYARNIEPGRILDRRNGAVLVKSSGEDAIWLDVEDGDSIAVGDYL